MKSVLQAVLNGSRPADAHPALPCWPDTWPGTPGRWPGWASPSVHVHPRDPDGHETLDPVHVGDAVAAIRPEVPDMEIGVTTGRWIQPDPAGASRPCSPGGTSASASPTCAR